MWKLPRSYHVHLLHCRLMLAFCVPSWLELLPLGIGSRRRALHAMVLAISAIVSLQKRLIICFGNARLGLTFGQSIPSQLLPGGPIGLLACLAAVSYAMLPSFLLLLAPLRRLLLPFHLSLKPNRLLCTLMNAPSMARWKSILTGLVCTINPQS